MLKWTCDARSTFALHQCTQQFNFIWNEIILLYLAEITTEMAHTPNHTNTYKLHFSIFFFFFFIISFAFAFAFAFRLLVHFNTTIEMTTVSKSHKNVVFRFQNARLRSRLIRIFCFVSRHVNEFIFDWSSHTLNSKRIHTKCRMNKCDSNVY